jgi:hypothetical protein
MKDSHVSVGRYLPLRKYFFVRPPRQWMPNEGRKASEGSPSSQKANVEL